ncbi:unnamed protein product [Paramecium sonneborni]|uniref:Uncharacterized protein n=1 Tax=Paramecium sonneborni TaxID=65129 RepID=A0A8S1PAV9_9CILI|nr:unnamed protein product [Paramecium sonneborni]
MDNKNIFLDLGENDLLTIKKTENEEVVSQFNQKTEQITSFGKKIIKGQQFWKEFYKQELIKSKKKHPQATHNELTSFISKKWKRKKQNKKLINKLKLKIKHENTTDITISSNNNDEIANIHQEEQKDEIIQKLKIQTFKLIYLDNICELKGETILEAIQNNMQLIYINKSNEINNQEQIFDLNQQKITQNNQEIPEITEAQKQPQQDSEDEPLNDEEDTNFQIKNKIMNYL